MTYGTVWGVQAGWRISKAYVPGLHDMRMCGPCWGGQGECHTSLRVLCTPNLHTGLGAERSGLQWGGHCRGAGWAVRCVVGVPVASMGLWRLVAVVHYGENSGGKEK